MAIGAPGGEVFKEFMTEALLLTGAGSLVGLVIGVGFSKIITASIGIPLHIDPKSFVFCVRPRRGLRLRVRSLPGLEGIAALSDGGAAL
jgi:ABC-type lipoprotein release transport system permease subunit